MTDVNPETDLVIARLVRSRPETIWRCWEDPELFRQWFTPPGVEVVESEHDLRPGGRSYTCMKLPDGTLMPLEGCFLLAEPYQRLVYTDSLAPGFRPVASGFMTVDVTLTPEPGGTRYAAHVLHPDAAARKSHEDMGFHDGWGTTFEQLDRLAMRLEQT